MGLRVMIKSLIMACCKTPLHCEADISMFQSATIPLPPLMFTEKLTLYIGRDPSAGLSDKDWHGVAKKKCSAQAGRFDLGCSKKREINSRVFCMEKYCVCYVHYGHCKGYSFLGTNHLPTP